jgi:hypothetical protein
MAISPKEQVSDRISGYVLVYDPATRESDSPAFAETLPELYARIVETAHERKPEYGYSVITMKNDGACASLPFHPENDPLPKTDDKTVAIAKWSRPVRSDGVPFVTIYIRLKDAGSDVIHRMLIADVSPGSSYIASSSVLEPRAIEGLSVRTQIPGLTALNTVVTDLSSS